MSFLLKSPILAELFGGGGKPAAPRQPHEVQKRLDNKKVTA